MMNMKAQKMKLFSLNEDSDVKKSNTSSIKNLKSFKEDDIDYSSPSRK